MISFPRAILFDLDDTMWPIAPVIVRAEAQLFAWLGEHAPGVSARFSIADLRARRLAMLAADPAWGIDLGALRRAGLQAAFAEAGEDPAKIDAAMQLFHQARNTIEAYADVLPALAVLKGMTRLGTLTNGNANLAAIGWAEHFEYSLSAAEAGCAKPDPAIFLRACAAMDLAPGEVLYVGDDLLLDVQGAQRAGLRAVWLRRSPSEAHLEHGVTPDAICADFDQLLAWLSVHNRQNPA